MAKNKMVKGKKKGQPGPSKNVFSSSPIGMEATQSGRTIVGRTRGPMVTPTNAGGLRVRNTERLTQLFCNVPGVFERTGYAFNPAAAVLCPWLSNIAKNYSMYRIHKLEWAYTPFVPVSTGGEVMMGVFYDEEDLTSYVATGDQQTLSCQAEFSAGPCYAGGAMASNESNRVSYFGVKADCSSVHRRYPWFLCDPATSAGANRNLSVGAHLGLGLVSSSSGVNGTIYITYDVEFIKPTSPTHQI